MITKREIQRLEGLLYLYALSKAKSKRKVAELLGTSVDTVNKYIADLEADMMTCFLKSNGRGTMITPEGKRILKISEDIVKAVRSMGDYADTAAAYSGIVRLATTDAISEFLGVDCLQEFFQLYPNINIESLIGNDLPNMDILEADVGICYDPPESPDLVLISVKSVRWGIFAAQSYIDKYGRPKDIKDMIEHHRICDKDNHERYVGKWKEIIDAANVVYRTNSIYSLRGALEAGLGVGICPYIFGESKLVHLHEIDIDFDITLYMIAHKDTKDMPRIRALIDFLKKLLDEKVALCGRYCSHNAG